MKNILVVGSINVDMVICTDRMPQIGETLSGSGFMINAGGKGANQAVAAAKLGGNVKMLGCVGNDLYGDMMIDHCKKYGVGTSGIIKKGDTSGVAVITVCNGDNCIILDAGANGRITPEIIDQNIDLINWSDYCIFQFEIPIETIKYAAKKAKMLGKIVVINPAPMENFSEELLEYADIFTPNLIECETLFGEKLNDHEKLKNAVKKLHNKGINNVIITLGSEGCIYNDGEEIKMHGIIKSEVVDTTAAGDSFVGGIVVSLAQGKSLDDAIDFATYTSSITVSRRGAGDSIPTYKEVIDYMNK